MFIFEVKKFFNAVQGVSDLMILPLKVTKIEPYRIFENMTISNPLLVFSLLLGKLQMVSLGKFKVEYQISLKNL